MQLSWKTIFGLSILATTGANQNPGKSRYILKGALIILIHIIYTFFIKQNEALIIRPIFNLRKAGDRYSWQQKKLKSKPINIGWIRTGSEKIMYSIVLQTIFHEYWNKIITKLVFILLYFILLAAETILVIT